MYTYKKKKRFNIYFVIFFRILFDFPSDSESIYIHIYMCVFNHSVTRGHTSCKNILRKHL